MSPSDFGRDPTAASRPDLANLTHRLDLPAAGDGTPVEEVRGYRYDGEDLVLPEGTEIATEEVENALGEPFTHTLDVASWDRGLNRAAMDKLEQQIADAVRQEASIVQMVRREVFPQIERGPGAPACAGVYQAELSAVVETQHHALFNGGTAAVDGTMKTHDTLPLTITQLGVALVSYAGDQGAWTHRVFRRELRATSSDVSPEELLEVLARRRGRGGLGQPDKKKQARMSELLGRGLMSYAERVILADHTDAPWRLGHGTPAPYELLTGSGNMDLLRVGLAAIERVVSDHQRFVYVPSADGDRLMLTIGHALRPLEFAIVHTDEMRMRPIIERGHLREAGGHLGRAVDFMRSVGPQIVVGVYRTYADVPPQVFYAHPDHAYQAALIAISDSILETHRGFPSLIDVAHHSCESYCGMDTFGPSIQVSYANSGTPLLYLPERETRG